MSPMERSMHLIQTCLHFGISDFCVCAGARNAPLVVALNKLQDSEPLSLCVRHFFDERSAAFFALGRTKSPGEAPAAVVTTSGTAVAELYPAIIEAHYTQRPLVLITADRPPSYRQSGAPQSIQQVGIFSHYAPTIDLGLSSTDVSLNSMDLGLSSTGLDLSPMGSGLVDPSLVDSSPAGPSPSFVDSSPMLKLRSELHSIHSPIHINISFDEPLFGSCEAFSGFENSTTETEDFSLPLFILGEVPEKYRSRLVEVLKKIHRPIYAEAPSGLRENDELFPLLIQSGPLSVKMAWQRHGFKSLLRIGSVPTLKFWRELDTLWTDLPVHSVSHLPFSGLARVTEKPQSFESFLEEWEVPGLKISELEAPELEVSLAELAHSSKVKEKTRNKEGKSSPWFLWDQEKSRKLQGLYKAFPHSEPSIVKELSQQIPSEDIVFLGNSLPIREWDLSASRKVPHTHIKANRGVNGIDGTISSFLGSMDAHKRNWCLLGDLSALYDLNALWIYGRMETPPFCIVVINNGGGKIFSQVFNNPSFENRHDIHFKNWAQLFGLEYHLFQSCSSKVDKDKVSRVDISKVKTTGAIIELQPDNKDSEGFWRAYNSLFQNNKTES